MLGLARFVTHSSGGSGPSLNFNFADNSPYLSQQITFTRASAGTFTGSNGLIQNAPVNLLTYSEQFDNAIWGKFAAGTGVVPVVTPNAAVAPDGTTTADSIVFNRGAGNTLTDQAGISQSPIVSSGAHTQSVWLKAASPGDIGKQLALRNVAAASYGIVTLTADWVRYTRTETGANSTWEIANRGTATANNTVTALVWGAQLVEGSVAGPYARTVASTSGAPRFDYDPVTLAARGLLIEEQRTNLLTYSEQFNNAAWVKTGLNTTGTPAWVNVAVAPDGTTTADKLIEDTSTGTHQAAQTVTTTAIAYTYSVYAKAAERSFILLYNTTAGFAKVFNLAAGSVGTGTVGTVTASISAAGNGWYRCAITGTATAAANDWRAYVLTSDTTTASYTGDGTSGLFIWGAQLEAGSFATSYIPTVASQVTRSFDFASVNTLSPWFNASEGTLLAEASVYAGRTSGNPIGIASITDATINNRLSAAFTNNALFNQPRFVAGGVSILNLSGGTVTLNVASKIASGYKTGNTASYANGTQIETSSAAFTFSPNQMLLGSGIPVSDPLCGHIRRITYYPRRLSNATLQQITS